MAELTAAPPFPDISDPTTFSERASNFFGWLAGTFVDEINVVVALGGVTQTVQSSTSDSTAGRLALVGMFGLGGSAILVGNAGVTDGSLVTGFYRYDTTAGSPSSGGPTGATQGALLHIRTTNGETQEFVVIAGTGSATAGSKWLRSRTTGAWGAWTGTAEASAYLAATQLGYKPGVGAGGTVTQLTSRTTSVTLNKITGSIVCYVGGVGLASGSSASFTLNNSAIEAGDVIVLSPVTSWFLRASLISMAAGSCRINVTNEGGTASSDALTINFAVIKAAST